MDTPEVDRSAAAVVALKAGEHIKSRLGFPTPLRRRLAWTMAVDTLTSLSIAVSRVVVISNQPALASRLARAGLQVDVQAEPARGGMNASLTHGAEIVQHAGFGVVLACVGDLPALRAESVRQVLRAARAVPRSFVSDASGVGTTMLIASEGAALEPHFQGRSAAAHQAGGAVHLDADRLGGPLADARLDVDSEVDLDTAIGLGLGAATGALVDPQTRRIGRYAVITVTEWRDGEGQPLAVTETGHRVVLPPAALSDGIRSARLGQRLHAVLAADRVLSAWW